MNETQYQFIGFLTVILLLTAIMPGLPTTAGAADMCSNLKLAGTWDSPGNAVDVKIAGSNAFIADSNGGLQIIDISVPDHPAYVGEMATHDAAAVFVQGNTAFIADSAYGLRIIDISDPSSPSLSHTVDTPDTANDVFISGSYAYIADGASDNATGGLAGLQIIDLSGAGPSISGAVDIKGYARGIYVDGNYAYVSTTGTGTGLEIIRISDLSTAGSANTTGSGNDVFVDAGFAYVSDGVEGLQIMGGIPVAPSVIGSCRPGGSAAHAVVNGDYIYLVNGSGIQVIDISHRDNPVAVASFLTTGSAMGIAVDGDYAYVADGNRGLRIIDISGVPPAVEVMPDTNNFGSTDTGSSSAPAEIKVTNHGCARLILGTLSLEGTDRQEFTVVSDMCSGAEIASYASCTIKVAFTPLTTGLKKASLVLPSNDDARTPSSISISGTATSPDIAVTPAADHDFGSIALNTTSPPLDFTVTNNGSSDLVISRLTVSGDDASHFLKSNDLCTGKTIAPDASCTFDTSFKPSSVGRREVILSISSNDPDTPVRTLTLTGTGQSPILAVTPEQHDFGGVRTGESASETFTVTNQGNISLVIGEITITGRTASLFPMQSDSCSGTTLPASGSCTFTVRFQPGSTGVKTATVHIPSNDADSPDTAVDITGTGTLAVIKLTPQSINFGDCLVGTRSGAITVTAVNTGTAPLNIGAIYLSGDGHTRFSMNNDQISGSQLPPSGQAAVDLIFSPDMTGIFRASLNIPSDDPGAPVAALPLRGTGALPVISVSPETWDYGRIFINRESGEKSFTVKNTGTVDLLPGIINITPSGGDFTIRDDEVSDYTISAGGKATFTVVFTPTSRGVQKASIHIPSNDTESSPVEIGITGTGEQSAIQVTPSSHNFGYVTAGRKSVSEQFTLANTGGKALNVSSAELSGEQKDIFTMEKDNCSGKKLEPGEICTFNALFQPVVSGVKTANILITSDDPDNPALTLPLKGIGDVPAIKASCLKYDFGNIPLERSSTPFRIKISGASGVPLKIDKVSLEGNAAKEFTLRTDSCSSASLEPSESCCVDVVFTPSDTGIMEAFLTVASNAGETPVLEISLLGSTVEDSARCSDISSMGTVPASGEAFDVAINGGYALMPDNLDGLKIVDLSDLEDLRIAATVPLPGEATAVDAQGNFAYVVTLDRGLHIIDISDPESPVHTGSVNTSGYARDVKVRGPYAYVADGLAGLHVIDITDPYAPVIRATIDTPGFALDVALQNDYAYVADADSGLQVISIANPLAPVITASEDTPGDALHVDISASSALVADGRPGLQVIDITDPYNPVLHYTVPVKKSAVAIHAEGGFAYTADGSAGIQIIDVTDPYHLMPEIAETVKTSGDAFGITLAYGLGFVAEGSEGMEIVDLRGCSMSSRQFHLSIAPDVHDFGEVITGQRSPGTRFTVMNTGPATVSFDAFLDGPDKGKFFIENNRCTAPLAPLTRCTLDVIFSPVVTGLESASLNLSDDGTGTASVIAQLQGRGIPVINFSASPRTGPAPLSVTFTDRSSDSIESWMWDFGDQGTSTEENPDHTFTRDGIYEVILTASDAGGTYTASHTIFVETGTVSHSYLPAVFNKTGLDSRLYFINTSSSSPLTGVIRFYDYDGEIPSCAQAVNLPAAGRGIFSVTDLLPRTTGITHAVLEADSDNVTGCVEYYRQGCSDAAVPLVQDVSPSTLYLPLIISNSSWWTGIAMMNTNSAQKEISLVFNNGEKRGVTLGPGEQKFVLIRDMFQGIARQDITSGMITNASGIAAMEFTGAGTMAGGMLPRGTEISEGWSYSLYGSGVQTGFIMHNPSSASAAVTAHPYSMNGSPLPAADFTIDPAGQYPGLPQILGLPAESIWLKLASSRDMTGMNFIFTTDGSLLAMMNMADTPSRHGIFPDISPESWTVLTFMNSADVPAAVSLTAYDNQGNALDSALVELSAHAHVLAVPQSLFAKDISDATYCTFAADQNIAAVQFKGSPDGSGMYALPALK